MHHRDQLGRHPRIDALVVQRDRQQEIAPLRAVPAGSIIVARKRGRGLSDRTDGCGGGRATGFGAAAAPSDYRFPETVFLAKMMAKYASYYEH
jgi:hypothetical protein